MKQIKAWLEGERNYDEGVAFYNKHGSDNALKSLLKLGSNSFTMIKLVAALEQLVSKEQPKPARQLPEKVRKWLKQREVYHNNLFYTPSESDRKKLCFAILSITTKLDRYFDHNEIDISDDPIPVEQGIPNNGWELHQLFNNNRSYMTKNAKAQEKQGEVKRREEQNKIIEERLKALNHGAV